MGFRFANVISSTQIALPELGEGVWIKVRDELTVGEKRAMFRDAIKGETPLGDGKVRIDYDQAKLGFATVLAYVTDWSQAYVADEQDRIKLTPSAIHALDEEDYRVIEAAVEKHIQEKKSQKAPRANAGPTTTKKASKTETPSAVAT